MRAPIGPSRSLDVSLTCDINYNNDGRKHTGRHCSIGQRLLLADLQRQSQEQIFWPTKQLRQLVSAAILMIVDDDDDDDQNKKKKKRRRRRRKSSGCAKDGPQLARGEQVALFFL